MNLVIARSTTLFFIVLSLTSLSCNRSKPTKSSPPSQASVPSKEEAGEQVKVVPVPPDLQKAVDSLVQAVETLNVSQALAGYADDYRSGTGRSKEGVREVLTRLQEGGVNIKVEKSEVEEVSAEKAKLRTHVRLRYKDTFRDIAEGEVIVTDTLRHFLRKEDHEWKICTDERVSTYREGRFGEQSPNVQLDVPAKLPEDDEYSITVSVQQEAGKNYQVMVGNYPEDPQFLPPPDIVTELPETGTLTANLPRNPSGYNEMVRITVIAEDQEGNFVGATTIAKFISGLQQDQPDEESEEEEAII